MSLKEIYVLSSVKLAYTTDFIGLREFSFFVRGVVGLVM
jgi:hypothetical protein